MVQTLIDQENQIHAVESLHLRFKQTGAMSARRLEKLVADYRRQTAGKEPPPGLFRAQWTGEYEFAFDASRVREVWSVRERTTRIWNGRQFRMLQEFEPGPARMTIHNRMFDFDFAGGHMACLRVGRHDFWFQKSSITAKELGTPEGFRLTGSEEVDGVTCQVLVNPLAERRVYVGANDGRIRRLSYLRLARPEDYLLAAAKAANREFVDGEDFNRWYEQLTAEELSAFDIALHEAMLEYSQPWVHFDFADYRELSPGFWFPAKQRSSSFERDGLGGFFLTGTSEKELVEARVDQPLADELFELEIPEGATVVDATYTPALTYKQDLHRTPAQWDAILKEHREVADSENERQAAQKELIGKPCPELPRAKWLNSPALTLESLRGQVVVLEFWSIDCGPCWGSVQHAQQLANSGVIVIGVHHIGASSKEVAGFLKRAELTFPVVIDEKVGEDISGRLAGQLQVHSIPNAVVVDPEGRLAAFGDLNQVWDVVRDLRRAQKAD